MKGKNHEKPSQRSDLCPLIVSVTGCSTRGAQLFTLKVAAKPPNSSWAWDWISLSGDFLSESAGARIRPPPRARLVSASVLTHVSVTSDFWRRLSAADYKAASASDVMSHGLWRAAASVRLVTSSDMTTLTFGGRAAGSALQCWCHGFTMPRPWYAESSPSRAMKKTVRFTSCLELLRMTARNRRKPPARPDPEEGGRRDSSQQESDLWRWIFNAPDWLLKL